MMTKVAEQEIKDSLKKSEFRGIIATVASTVTVLVAIFFGGLQIVDAVKAGIRIENEARFNQFKSEQDKRDREQDYEIISLKNSNSIKK